MRKKNIDCVTALWFSQLPIVSFFRFRLAIRERYCRNHDRAIGAIIPLIGNSHASENHAKIGKALYTEFEILICQVKCKSWNCSLTLKTYINCTNPSFYKRTQFTTITILKLRSIKFFCVVICT